MGGCRQGQAGEAGTGREGRRDKHRQAQAGMGKKSRGRAGGVVGQRGPQPVGAEPPYPGSGSSAVPPTSPKRGLGWKTRPGWETCSRLRKIPRAGRRSRCPPPLLGAAHPGSAHQGGRLANLGSGLEGGPAAVGSFFLSPVTHEQFVSPEGIRRADFPGLHPAQPSPPTPPPPRHLPGCPKSRATPPFPSPRSKNSTPAPAWAIPRGRSCPGRWRCRSRPA